MNDVMTVREASEKWGLSVRRIVTLCNEGRFEGAMRFGRNWAIPVSTERPKDMRIKSGKYISKKEE